MSIRLASALTEWLSEEGDASEWRAERSESRGRGTTGTEHVASHQPVLTAKREGDVPESELLDAVEVRARVSAGTRMSIRFDRGQDLLLPRALARMDADPETLVEGLEAYGLSERIVVAVVSDHGTEFLEHGAHGHGHTMYGGLNRVPMLLWGPGRVPAGRKIGVTVRTIDLPHPPGAEPAAGTRERSGEECPPSARRRRRGRLEPAGRDGASPAA